MSSNQRIRTALIDTNFVIALLNRRDPFHRASAEAIRNAPCSQWVTTCAVITESMYFLGAELGVSGQHTLCDLIRDGTYQVAQTLDVALVQRYIGQYADMPLDFADATMAVHAMASGIKHIYTHDEHFRAIRVPIDTTRALNVIP